MCSNAKQDWFRAVSNNDKDYIKQKLKLLGTFNSVNDDPTYQIYGFCGLHCACTTSLTSSGFYCPKSIC